MKIRISILIIFFIGSFALLPEAGKKNATGFSLPYHPTPLQLKIPEGWPKPSTNIFANNPLTEEGFRLGRKLFYDGRLSKDGNFACASCHQQFAAFATTITTLAMAFTTSLLPAMHRHYSIWHGLLFSIGMGALIILKCRRYRL